VASAALPLSLSAGGALSIASASATSSGALSSSDWTTFNNKVSSSDSRLSDARNPLPNSSYYVENGTALQSNASFNVDGSGGVGGNLTVGGNLNVGGSLSGFRVQNASADPVPCAASNLGQLYFNTVTGDFRGCNGATWVAISTNAGCVDVTAQWMPHLARVTVTTTITIRAGSPRRRRR
jgi:hypothetical protein